MAIHLDYPSLNPWSAGFLQFDVKLGDLDHNLQKVRDGLARLQPTSSAVVVLPEMWSCGFDYHNLAGHSARTPVVLAELGQLAAKGKIHLAGSLPEKVEADGRVLYYNTMYLIGPEGICGSYRKQQMFGPMAEDRHFTAGHNPQSINTALGPVAALVCYDLRFPDLTRLQTDQGAQLLVVSAQWPKVRWEQWRTLLIARAIENQIFVAACNRCGTTGEVEFGGHSMVVAPDGTVLAEAETGEEAVLVQLDSQMISEIRSRFTTVGVSPYRRPDRDKVVGLDQLKMIVDHYKEMGRRVVFTNGCFDILHEGHVTYLEAARRCGDCLIVGMNSDSSIRTIKGPDRPVNSEGSRARLLAALGCVDHVVMFSEETPYNLIATLMPDVLAKGGDWPVAEIVGAPEVIAAGGQVISIPLVENFSTTSLIEKIQKTD
ncbi:MAG: D-glycero-beta-D-manno-heptose 1-phosphate adenylyltransferase [Proteobacteria bacterium]|nr:D-glycero-beta-D-manno-heptose 1-phosphate adenylyltransferase [Pseudomonadota bacterium]MBU1715511.1 D-glycero-beta-D-manno-heptose 1-phosphate adenylyltransferase [Pseudomonadota bacterium]